MQWVIHRKADSRWTRFSFLSSRGLATQPSRRSSASRPRTSGPPMAAPRSKMAASPPGWPVTRSSPPPSARNHRRCVVSDFAANDKFARTTRRDLEHPLTAINAGHSARICCGSDHRGDLCILTPKALIFSVNRDDCRVSLQM